MLVFATKTNDEQGYDLFKGSYEECKKYCKSVIPAEWDSVNICEDNGIIKLRIVKNGRPADGYLKLVKEIEKKKKTFTR